MALQNSISIKSQLQHLIRLALADHNFHKDEKVMIEILAKANKVSESEIKTLIDDELNNKSQHPIEVPSLSFDEKFEHLYNIVQLMKIDNEIYLSEIRYCEDLADKLGFDKNVIKELSSKIYSSPAITVDREKLKDSIKKYIKS